jgi:SAM-dependent methyltransferase
MQDVTKRYREDLRGNASEFPVTQMSAVLAEAISELLDQPTPINSALDVGTGSGIHAALLVASGISEVFAIDISEGAIEGAMARFLRVLGGGDHDGALRTTPHFQVLDVDQLETLNRMFQLIVTNPPSFFQPRPSDRARFSAVECGVYDGERSRWRDPKHAFLYRALARIHLILEPGGYFLCTWPGLERRLAHDLDASGEPLVHPTALLTQWFGWQFSNAPTASTWPDFYRFRAEIGDYGLGEAFLVSLSDDLHSGRYSNLVHPPWKTGPTFDFGLLALQRDRADQNLFHLIDLHLLSSAGSA